MIVCTLCEYRKAIDAVELLDYPKDFDAVNWCKTCIISQVFRLENRMIWCWSMKLENRVYLINKSSVSGIQGCLIKRPCRIFFSRIYKKHECFVVVHHLKSRVYVWLRAFIYWDWSRANYIDNATLEKPKKKKKDNEGLLHAGRVLSQV